MKLVCNHSPLRFLRLAALAAAFVALQGCGAYFNTYYNTKKLYKEAMQEQKRRQGDKPSSVEIQKYDKTIEKASKLLQFHPGSKYVDDSLVLIGECFYYKQDYLKAQRKFQELITIFPKSGLVPRAQVWLAKTNIELRDYTAAERVLHELQRREKKGEMFDQAQYYLGEIYFRQKQVPQAAKAFEAAARKLNDQKMRGAAYMRLGECCMAMQQYDLAAGALRRAGAAAKNDVDFKFQAYLQYAISLKYERRFDKALNTLDDMLGEFSTHRDLPLVKLEMAECARLQGKIESAMRQYAAVIENHQRTDASAAAYFALGEIHERLTGDFNKAKECYDNVGRESARSAKLAEATRRSKAAGDLIRLKETIATLERQRVSLTKGKSDSLQRVANAKAKSPGVERHSISRIPRRARAAGMTSLPAAVTQSGDPTKVAAELAKNKILLAELYLFNFNNPDSAMHEYLDVFEFFPQTEYAPQAMYSLAYILGEAPATLSMRDSILQVLAKQYGNTPQGHGAKRRLGQADTLSSPTLPKLLRDAEDYLVKQKNPQAALRLYEEFLQQQPETKLAAQSLYAMGWIYEHELADNQQALAAYKKLIETYPDSPMAHQVRRKVAAAEQKKDEPAKPEQMATTGNGALPPTTASADTLQAQPEDSTAAEQDIDDVEMMSRRTKDLKPPQKPVADEAVDDPQKEKKKPENAEPPKP